MRNSWAALERLAGFFIQEHNAVLPHPAFRGQTPDEMYLGTGLTVPDDLAQAKAAARAARLVANQGRTCAACPRSALTESPAKEDPAA